MFNFPVHFLWEISGVELTMDEVIDDLSHLFLPKEIITSLAF